MNFWAITNGSENMVIITMVEEQNRKKGHEMVKFYNNEKHGLEVIEILSFMAICRNIS